MIVGSTLSGTTLERRKRRCRPYLRILPIRRREKARIVARKRSRHELKWRRTRSGLSRIP
jgi:hypothetical protein